MDDQEWTKKLIAVGEDLVAALQRRLTWEHGFYRGDLSRSIEYRITEMGLQLVMEDYAEYLEYGTPNPTTPEEIMDWVEKKILPKIRFKHNKKTETKQKIATALAKHISEYGPRPFPFIRTTLDEDLPGILQRNGF
jgi:hypothetical protein